MIITSEFFSFNVWEWFLHSSVLERTESDLSKINWLRGVIILNPIVLLGAGFHCVTLLSDLFRLSGIRSQSWLWVAWPRDHEVRINICVVFLFIYLCENIRIMDYLLSCFFKKDQIILSKLYHFNYLLISLTIHMNGNSF